MIYLAFLDIQPTPAEPTRIRFHLDENHTVSLPSTGPHKPREGLILPYLSRQPIHVSVDPAHPIAIGEAQTNPAREIQVIGPGGFEYTVRVLVVSTSNRPEFDDSSPLPVNIAITLNDSSVCSMDTLAQFLETSPTDELDLRAFALANTLSLDKAVIFYRNWL